MTFENGAFCLISLRKTSFDEHLHCDYVVVIPVQHQSQGSTYLTVHFMKEKNVTKESVKPMYVCKGHGEQTD